MKIEKLRLYLESTMFNYYFDENRDGHGDTVKLFEAIGAGKYEGYTSEYAEIELRRAFEPKRSDMLALIDRYRIARLGAEDEAYRLADLYVNNNVIPERFRFDGVHIAIASIHGLDCICTYNFKHINHVRTKLMTARINNVEGYGSMVICMAREVLEDEVEFD
jgi:predicted nucleic acid-binding protein